jgi:hypothetical protein
MESYGKPTFFEKVRDNNRKVLFKTQANTRLGDKNSKMSGTDLKIIYYLTQKAADICYGYKIALKIQFLLYQRISSKNN